MGTTYHVVNTRKRQYFNPGWMGNSKFGGLLNGIGGHALAMLLFPQERSPLLPPLESWAGDPLYVVGDEPEERPFPGLSYEDDGGRCAYEVHVEEYDDITLNLIDSVLGHWRVSDWFFERADKHDHDFLLLANIALYLSPEFEKTFAKRYGKNWQQRYKRAVKALSSYFFPMPMTEENRKNIGGVPRRVE